MYVCVCVSVRVCINIYIVDICKFRNLMRIRELSKIFKNITFLFVLLFSQFSFIKISLFYSKN